LAETNHQTQAGDWAIGLVPIRFRHIIKYVVDSYNNEAKLKDFLASDLDNLRHYVINQIKEP